MGFALARSKVWLAGWFVIGAGLVVVPGAGVSGPRCAILRPTFVATLDITGPPESPGFIWHEDESALPEIGSSTVRVRLVAGGTRNSTLTTVTETRALQIESIERAGEPPRDEIYQPIVEALGESELAGDLLREVWRYAAAEGWDTRVGGFSAWLETDPSFVRHMSTHETLATRSSSRRLIGALLGLSTIPILVGVVAAGMGNWFGHLIDDALAAGRDPFECPCGYDRRGLSEESPCPECGEAAVGSIRESV